MRKKRKNNHSGYNVGNTKIWYRDDGYDYDYGNEYYDDDDVVIIMILKVMIMIW